MTYQQTSASVQGNPNVGANAAAAVFFSSGAVTFAAYMQMLKANQDAMNDMAHLAETTATLRADLVQTMATSTQSMYEDDATQLEFQKDEGITSSVASGLQAGVAGAGMAGVKSASSNSAAMDDLTAQVNKMTPAAGNIVGHAGGVNANAAQTAAIAEVKTQIIGKTFDYTGKNMNSQISTTNGTNVTLREVIASAQGDERTQVLAGVGDAKELATKTLLAKQNYVQTLSQGANMIVQSASGMPNAYFKQGEANAMNQKGADSMAQQYAQASSQFAQETNQSQTQQSETRNRSSEQVWQSIHETVQIDTRG